MSDITIYEEWNRTLVRLGKGRGSRKLYVRTNKATGVRYSIYDTGGNCVAQLGAVAKDQAIARACKLLRDGVYHARVDAGRRAMAFLESNIRENEEKQRARKIARAKNVTV